jgi:PAS domain S-box-containing protein
MNDKINKTALLNVLSLEDSPIDFEIVSEKLVDAGYNLQISRVENATEFTESIRSNTHDIILADYNLPGFDAFEALELANEYCPKVPFICVSGSIGEIMAIELLKMGAVDYVLKDRLERLPFAVQRALGEANEKNARIGAEEELKKSEERLRDIIFSTADWVWEVDEYGRYTYSSQRGNDLFDIPTEEIIGKTPFDFMPENEAARIGTIFSEIIANKAPIKDLENWNIGKHGKDICLLTNGLPILDSEGRLKGYRGVDKNITERKQAEQELVKAKENAEASDRLKTAFMNNISHEIRTPLNGILGFGQIITDTSFSKDEKVVYYRMLNESCDRLLNTITNIMDISLLTSGNLKIKKNEVILYDLISRISENFNVACKQKNIFISIQNINLEKGYTIFTDEDLLSKIFHQLIDNAVKFTTNGPISIGCEKIGNELHCFVKDSGIGISNEHKSRIFVNFEQEDCANTRKYEGTGIGLSIAKGLTELLGGKIWLDSEKGLGTTFYFSLPIETNVIK